MARGGISNKSDNLESNEYQDTEIILESNSNSSEIKKPDSSYLNFGEVLYAGKSKLSSKSIDGSDSYFCIDDFHRMESTFGLPISRVISSSSSSHSVLILEDGLVMTLGRNDFGQLGIGNNSTTQVVPLLVMSLSPFKIIDAACGRAHTIFLTDAGEVFTCGSNKFGQLGLGSAVTGTAMKDNILFPRLIRTTLKGVKIIKVGAGRDFSIALDDKGRLWSWGSREHGQLGLGEEHSKSSEPQWVPKPIRSLRGSNRANIKDFDCGRHHVVALAENGTIYSWGFAGFGRLGLKIDRLSVKDVSEPLPLDKVISNVKDVVSGADNSLALVDMNNGGLLYGWGLLKRGGDPQNKPAVYTDTQSCSFDWIRAGHSNFFGYISSPPTLIAWGAPMQYGELGFGSGAKRSSVKPKVVEPLRGMSIIDCAAGLGHSLVIVDRRSPGFEEIPVWGALPDQEFPPSPVPGTTFQSATGIKPRAKRGRPSKTTNKLKEIVSANDKVNESTENIKNLPKIRINSKPSPAEGSRVKMKIVVKPEKEIKKEKRKRPIIKFKTLKKIQ